jgi:hypothetical protein
MRDTMTDNTNFEFIHYGTKSKVVLFIGFVCWLINMYYALFALTKPLVPETAKFLFIMFVAWGLYAYLLSLCLRADNPDWENDD